MHFARVFCTVSCVCLSSATAFADCYSVGFFRTCTYSTATMEPDESTGGGSEQSSTVYGGTGSPGQDGAPGTSGSSISYGTSSSGSSTGSRDEYFEDWCERFGCN
jgi:hypothetical protein